MESIVSFVYGLGGGFSIFAIAWFASFWWLHDIWSHKADREWWAEGLEINAGRSRYRRFLERRLNAFSAFLCARQRRFQESWHDDDRRAPAPDTEAAAQDPAWSWALLDFSFFLAMIYPCLIMVGLWVVTGERVIVSGALALPLEAWPVRLLFGVVVFYAVILVAFAEVRPTRHFTFKIILANALGLTALGLLPLDETGRIIPAAVAAISFSVAGFAWSSIASTVVGVSLPMGYALFAAHGLTGSVDDGWADFLLNSVLFAAPIIVALVLLRAPFGLLQNVRRLFLLQAVLLLAALVSLSSPTPTGIVRNQAVFTVAIFCGLLPLLNCWADFLSVGTTRFLLRAGTRRWTWFCAMSDVVLGLASFVALGFGIVAAVALVIHWNGPEILDLARLLDADHPLGLLQSPERYWWLWLSLLTTLVPTLIHACVASFSLIAMWPQRWREGIAKGLRSGTPTLGRAATLTLSVLMAASVAVPLTLIWWAGAFAFSHFPGLGEGLVDLFRWFAVVTGAIPGG